MASSVRGASLVVVATIGTVEALKDQGGLYRWKNYAKSNMGAFSQAKRKLSSIDRVMTEEKANHAEESLRKVMYLSCWGPY